MSRGQMTVPLTTDQVFNWLLRATEEEGRAAAALDGPLGERRAEFMSHLDEYRALCFACARAATLDDFADLSERMAALAVQMRRMLR